MKIVNDTNVHDNVHVGMLRDENGVSLVSKVCRGKITWSEYYDEWVKRKGFKNCDEYHNEWAKRRGYKDFNEYQSELNHKSRRCLVFDENKECLKYLGVHIAEGLLFRIFENEVQKMPSRNVGYDFICGKGYKIDVKSVCLGNDNSWVIPIKKNAVADYFLIIVFDNRKNLNVLHVWLMKSDVVIVTRQTCMKLNEKVTFVIRNDSRSLEEYKKYEMIDKLDNVKKICDEFKDKEIG